MVTNVVTALSFRSGRVVFWLKIPTNTSQTAGCCLQSSHRADPVHFLMRSSAQTGDLDYVTLIPVVETFTVAGTVVSLSQIKHL